MTLSLCMIVKNEEEVLARCLDSANALFDEIIIVDTGSTDKTKEIASKYTSNLHDFNWIDDFSAARNFSFSKATCDYIMWLDADDIIEKEHLGKLLILKQNLPKTTDVVMIKYHIAFDSNNNPTFSYYRERIVKNNNTFIWHDPVHEVITPHGEILYCDCAISHYKTKNITSERNLKIYNSLLASGNKLSPRQKFYYSRELYFNKQIDSAILSFIDYLENYNGWIENKIEAYYNLANCYQLKSDAKKCLHSLFQSFYLDTPRAEILCKIGEVLVDNKRFDEAIYWYKLALLCNVNYEKCGFISIDYYNFIPNIMLCVCYYEKNNLQKAIYYNNKAAKIKPKDASVLSNKSFFKNLKSKKEDKIKLLPS